MTIHLAIDGNEIILRAAYHQDIIDLCKRLGGRWDGRCWRLPLESGEAIAANRSAIAGWHNATVRARRARYSQG